MNYDKYISEIAKGIKPSGIRKFFDVANTMKDAISLGVGEPDFVTGQLEMPLLQVLKGGILNILPTQVCQN